MEDGLGEDLSWFWRGWFYRSDVVDQAVDSAVVKPDSTGQKIARVYLSSPGALPMPIELRLTYAGGATENVRLPVEAWLFGNAYVYERPVSADLTKVEVDPWHHFPDVRRSNNQWQGTSR